MLQTRDWLICFTRCAQNCRSLCVCVSRHEVPILCNLEIYIINQISYFPCKAGRNGNTGPIYHMTMFAWKSLCSSHVSSWLCDPHHCLFSWLQLHSLIHVSCLATICIWAYDQWLHRILYLKWTGLILSIVYNTTFDRKRLSQHVPMSH